MDRWNLRSILLILFLSNASFVRYCYLITLHPMKKEFTVYKNIGFIFWYYFVMEEFSWKMDTSYNKTWDIQRMDYLRRSSRRSHATSSIFSLHSLAEAPVDTTRRIAATHNCINGCPIFIPINGICINVVGEK